MAAVERERLGTGVLFVGAGPATLSAAIRFVDPCRERGIDPPQMLVIEKGVGDRGAPALRRSVKPRGRRCGRRLERRLSGESP